MSSSWVDFVHFEPWIDSLNTIIKETLRKALRKKTKLRLLSEFLGNLTSLLLKEEEAANLFDNPTHETFVVSQETSNIVNLWCLSDALEEAERYSHHLTTHMNDIASSPQALTKD